MPEFDTYRGIERYAKDPHNSANQLCFITLLKQARTKAVWNTITSFNGSDLQNGIMLYTGSAIKEPPKKTTSIDTIDDVLSMSVAEQDKLFADICKSVGVPIDPSTLMSARQRGKE